MSKISLSPSTCSPLSKAAVFTAVIAFTLLTSAPQAAETCATAPTCAELGYTLTSTTNCVGTPLKCPFDKTKFYCTQKQDAAAAAMPDYSKVMDRTVRTTYTASTNGYIYGFEVNNTTTSKCGYAIYIDGRNVRISSCQVDWVNVMWTYPVKKGSTYSVSSGYGDVYYQWVSSN